MSRLKSIRRRDQVSGIALMSWGKGTAGQGRPDQRLSRCVRREAGIDFDPRKILDFDTPAERFHQFVASTG
ncbi:hypothetical protein [Burkholderia gladioli]|uniref:hypothetical protein n=1 Tax=Burkholderia gladioli TaxID=28095 RepID=UPI000CDA1A67|nr:hypothetical protein [Burkholderia gladioli]